MKTLVTPVRAYCTIQHMHNFYDLWAYSRFLSSEIAEETTHKSRVYLYVCSLSFSLPPPFLSLPLSLSLSFLPTPLRRVWLRLVYLKVIDSTCWRSRGREPPLPATPSLPQHSLWGEPIIWSSDPFIWKYWWKIEIILYVYNGVIIIELVLSQ